MRLLARIIGFTLLAILIVVITGWIWYLNQLHTVIKNPGYSQIEINQGDTSHEIITTLVEKKFIKHYYVAAMYVLGKDIMFMPGLFEIPANYTVPQLMEVLSSEKNKETKITIPEGWTKEQIADLLATHKLNREKFLVAAKDYEGQLFPDTYYIDEKTTEVDFFNKMHNEYLTRVKDLNITRNTLILASIVEREARHNDERPIIAGIYQNRININMALQADPTVQYAKYTNLGQAPVKDGKIDYWAPITVADYTGVKSPFNTYLSAGLPPAPICNPGIKSLEAAANPASTNAYFFFSTSDGKLITSKTLAEHNANKVKYLK